MYWEGRVKEIIKGVNELTYYREVRKGAPKNCV